MIARENPDATKLILSESRTDTAVGPTRMAGYANPVGDEPNQFR